jgi:hypothetical protein
LKKEAIVASDALEAAIYQELARVYVCTLDELSGLLLSRFSRPHVAATVERLIENGSISQRSSDASRVLLWLPPLRSARRPRPDGPAGHPMDSDMAKAEYELLADDTNASFTPL